MHLYECCQVQLSAFVLLLTAPPYALAYCSTAHNNGHSPSSLNLMFPACSVLL